MDIQLWVALAIVGVCAVYVIRKAYFSVAKGEGHACENCGTEAKFKVKK